MIFAALITVLGWALATIGCIVGLAILFIIIYDVYLIENKYRSISRRTLLLCQQYPIVAAILSGIVCYLIGLLSGHLWWPQYVYIHE